MGNLKTWAGRLQSWALGVSVWVKIMGIGVGLVTLLGVQMIWHVRSSCRTTLESELERQTHTFLVDVPTLSPDTFVKAPAERITTVLAGLLERHPEFISLDYLNADGNLVAHASAASAPVERSLFKLTVPIKPAGAGSLRATVSRRMIQSHLNDLTRQMLFIAIIIALLAIAATWALTRIIVRPIQELVNATTEVQRGNLGVRTDRYADDELGRLADAFNDMTRALEEKDAVRSHLLQRIISAQEEERARVAQELHDELGQSLTSIILSLKHIETRNTENVTAICRDLREEAARTLEVTHDLAMALRPTALRDLGLCDALRTHARSCRKRFDMNIDIATIGFDDMTRFPEAIEVAIYRIVQEALTNSANHGKAKSVSVVLQLQGNSIQTTIEDDGSGFDGANWRFLSLDHKRMGLLGMEERARSLRGTFSLESTPMGGTTIFLNLPLNPPAVVSK